MLPKPSQVTATCCFGESNIKSPNLVNGLIWAYLIPHLVQLCMVPINTSWYPRMTNLLVVIQGCSKLVHALEASGMLAIAQSHRVVFVLLTHCLVDCHLAIRKLDCVVLVKLGDCQWGCCLTSREGGTANSRWQLQYGKVGSHGGGDLEIFWGEGGYVAFSLGLIPLQLHNVPT